jgi:hypothetical protein
LSNSSFLIPTGLKGLWPAISKTIVVSLYSFEFVSLNDLLPYVQKPLDIHQIDGRSVNVMHIFNSAPRRNRSHDHRHYTSPIFHDVSLNDLLPFMQKPLGIHHIRSKLFSLPLSKLHALYNSCLVNNVTNPNSNEYKLTGIVLDIAGHRPFKPAGIKKDEIDKRSFLKLSIKWIVNT